MAIRDHILDLLHHMEWADALVWRTVLAMPIAAQGDGRLRDVLQHFHLTQRAFLAIWRGDPLDFSDAMEPKDLATIRQWAVDVNAGIAEFVAGVDDDSLERRVEIPWAKEIEERWGSVGEVTVAETLLQVAMHSAYHRGQANTRIRELGGEPPLTDYIGWIWMKRPAPEW